MSTSKRIIKLSELPFEEMIDIGGHEYQFKGYEKRKTKYGNIEHFIFKCEKPKHEKIVERFTSSTVKISVQDGKYKWIC